MIYNKSFTLALALLDKSKLENLSTHGFCCVKDELLIMLQITIQVLLPCNLVHQVHLYHSYRTLVIVYFKRLDIMSILPCFIKMLNCRQKLPSYQKTVDNKYFYFRQRRGKHTISRNYCNKEQYSIYQEMFLSIMKYKIHFILVTCFQV